MNAQDYFDDCCCDVIDAIGKLQEVFCSPDDVPSRTEAQMIRLAWEDLKAKYERWGDALNEVTK